MLHCLWLFPAQAGFTAAQQASRLLLCCRPPATCARSVCFLSLSPTSPSLPVPGLEPTAPHPQQPLPSPRSRRQLVSQVPALATGPSHRHCLGLATGSVLRSCSGAALWLAQPVRGGFLAAPVDPANTPCSPPVQPQLSAVPVPPRWGCLSWDWVGAAREPSSLRCESRGAGWSPARLPGAGCLCMAGHAPQGGQLCSTPGPNTLASPSKEPGAAQ